MFIAHVFQFLAWPSRLTLQLLLTHLIGPFKSSLNQRQCHLKQNAGQLYRPPASAMPPVAI